MTHFFGHICRFTITTPLNNHPSDALERPEEASEDRAAAARAAQAGELSDPVLHLRHRAAPLLQATRRSTRLVEQVTLIAFIIQITEANRYCDVTLMENRRSVAITFCHINR